MDNCQNWRQARRELGLEKPPESCFLYLDAKYKDTSPAEIYLDVGFGPHRRFTV